jgi:hypothetical protein
MKNRKKFAAQLSLVLTFLVLVWCNQIYPLNSYSRGHEGKRNGY